MKILFCNIGWMKNYKRQTANDPLIGGGSFVDENGYGGEVTNFYSINRVCYGYVRANSARLDLERIAKVKIVEQDFIDDVCIVWVTKKPNGKRVIVGWYKNAKVYREQKHLLNNQDKIDYWFEAKIDNCVLIPAEERAFPYPSGKGFMSSKMYTYADPSLEEYTQDQIDIVDNYVQSVKKFINNYGKLPQEQIALEEDLVNIEYGKDDETTKTQLVAARLGQGKFRKDLLGIYPECPVTEVKLGTLLRASHIKPWRACSNDERLDPNNGFMLAAHVDALFDKGYLSFEDDGSLLISRLCLNDIDKLHIDKNTKIKINEETKKYLQWHRENLFIK